MILIGNREEVKKLDLTAVTRRDVDAILKYMSKFEYVSMAFIRIKALHLINGTNLVLQEINATIDAEVRNIENILISIF